MDNIPHSEDSVQADRSESAEAQGRRLEWEAAMIAEADASVAAGRLIDASEIDAWIDSIGTGHELPPPHRSR
jgi:predicted transcriptional regulator